MSPIELTPAERDTLPWAKQQQLLEERKRAWLDSLKVGDEFFYSRYGNGGIFKVARLTATQIVDTEGYRYRRSDGVLIGSGSRMWVIEPVTEKIREKIKALETRRAFDDIVQQAKKKKLDDDEIAVMLDALQAHRAKRQEAV